MTRKKLFVVSVWLCHRTLGSLDPCFKKIPYLTEVEQTVTCIWLQARDELAAIIKDDQDRQESQETEESQSSHNRGDPDPSSPS